MKDHESIQEKFLKKITIILEANFAKESFGVSELANEVGISRSQLHRKLHAISSKSTSQFIREFRLQKAMKMLQNNVATASEIAYKVGFSSPTYFNTSFKEYYGYTPGEVKYKEYEYIDNINEVEKNLKPLLSKKKLLTISVLTIILVSLIFFYFYNTTYKTTSKDTHNDILQKKNTKKAIAVLPLKNWSGDPDLEYISDGMTDAIISRLAKVSSIKKVIPLTSVLKYKNSTKSIGEISNELQVDNILQGNFQLSGDEIRIKLQLIEATSNDHFWSNEYSSVLKSTDIFAMQSKVAENVANKMGAEITSVELEAINKIPTNNSDAYSYYQQAEHLVNKFDRKSLEKAAPMYEKAIALDTNFVQAYIQLSNLWLGYGLYFGIKKEQEAWNKAKSILEKASEIDSTNFDIKLNLNIGYFYYDWDFNKFENFYKSILNENNKYIGWTVDYALKTGRYNIALEKLDVWLLHDTSVGNTYNALKAMLHFLMDEKSKALKLLEQVDSYHNNDLYYLLETSKLYYYLQEIEKSKIQLDKLKSTFSDRPPIVLWLSLLHAELNEDEKDKRENFDLLVERYNEFASGSPAWFIALYYCHVKDYGKAFEWLQKSYDRHEVEMTWLKAEPLLKPIRNDKRYLELYNKIGFPEID